MKDHIRRSLIYLVLFLGLFAFQQSFSEVYKTVDEDGNVVYTDQAPEPGAVPLDLPKLSIISPQAPTKRPVVTSMPEEPGVNDEPGQEVTSLKKLRRSYRDFAITHPTQDQTFYATETKMQVAWTTQYVLHKGMTVVLFVDGESQPPTRNPVFNLSDVWRGEHVVSAELRDARNRRIAATTPVTFHMKQNSAIFTARRNRRG